MIHFLTSDHSVDDARQLTNAGLYGRVIQPIDIPDMNSRNTNMCLVKSILGIPDSVQWKHSDATIDFNSDKKSIAMCWVAQISRHILESQTSDCLRILYPEAFLSPNAQSNLIRFLVDAHQAKHLTLVLKTHSDHILNGLRVAVKQKVLTPDEVKIHFTSHKQKSDFTIQADANIEPSSEGFFDQLNTDLNIMLDIEGKVRNKPVGFFDTYLNDMAKLF